MHTEINIRRFHYYVIVLKILSTMFPSLLSDHTKIYIINVERTDFFVERTDYFWNNLTWNDLTMERNDRKPTDRMRVMNKL